MKRKTKKGLLVAIVLGFLIFVIVWIFLKPSFQEKKFLHSSFVSLKFIKFDLSTKGSIDSLSDNTKDIPSIVNAEKVFCKDKTNWVDRKFLVTGYYQRCIPPKNPQGKNPIQKWGSSFDSWAMNIDAWKAAKDFGWGISQKEWNKLTEIPYNSKELHYFNFPILWDKNPKFSGGKRTVLMLDSDNIVVLPEAIFEKYLIAAKEWVIPNNVSFDVLKNRVKNGTEAERAYAIRMLGRKKDKRGLAIIKPFLSGNNIRLKKAAEYALKHLKEK